MTLTMRKLTVYVVFRLNYNLPDSNLHCSPHSRLVVFIATLPCGVAARAHMSLCSVPCAADSQPFTLIRPPGNQFSLDSAFWLPICTLLLDTLHLGVLPSKSCLHYPRKWHNFVCRRFPTLFTLIRPPGNQFSLDSAFLDPILCLATGHSPPGSASIKILLTRASGAISCVVDSRRYLP